MDTCNAFKSLAIEGRQKTTRKPMRIHEMDLGLQMSARQPGKTPRLQPVRVGPLLEAMERSSSKKNSYGNIRRQLYNEASDHTLPDALMIGGPKSSTENSVEKLINDGSTGKSPAVRLGLSKSDGKVKINARMMPMRIHEMDLGLPKSARQPGEIRRLQPIRVGPLLEAMEQSNTKRNFSARRINVASAGTRNVRRQLHNEAAYQSPPDTRIIGGSHVNTGNSVKKLINVGSPGKSQAVRVGLSKSDGKLKMNDQKSQPIRVKLLMESWEKSQTAKRAGKTSVMGGLRSANVRRRLYSIVPSPGISHKVEKKTLALNKSQKTANTPQKVKKTVKSHAEATKNTVVTQKPSRDSFLLPPNSIRDKHISLKTENTIIEEAPESLFSKEQNNPNSKKISEEIKTVITPDVDQTACAPAAESLPHASQFDQSVVADSSQESEKIFESCIEFPRPSVIIGLPTSTVLKTRNQSVSSESSSKSDFALLHPPLQELNKNSTMPLERLDAVDTSLQDLLGNFQHDPVVSSRSNILPCNSCLRNCESSEQSLTQIDRQTLSRLHQNTKLCVQTFEESLLSMKKMLQTIENIINSPEQERKPLQTKQQNNYDKDFAEGDKENLPTINSKEQSQKPEEYGEKTQRRSSRLSAVETRSIQNTDDSFSRIEKDLNITHDKSKSRTPKKCTPVKQKPVDPRSRRSIREYMALKSCAKFLQTPDHKGFPTPKFEKTGTPAQRRAVERALSLRVLNQLHNLYDESPE